MPVSWRGLVIVVAAVAAAAVLVGCSSGGGSGGVGVPVSDLPSVTGVEADRVGRADRADPVEEAAVRAVHTRVMTELFARDERVDDPTDILDLAEELTTGQLLTDISDSVNRRLLSGYKAVGEGYESHVVSVELTGDTTATVLDCSRDTRAFYGANGSLLVPADTYFKLRQSQLVLIDEQWFVQELRSTGAGRCNPSQP